MKLFFILSFALFTTTHSLANSAHQQIDRCSGNATCVAKVLADLIQGHTSPPISGESVKFFYDDGVCDFNNLIAVVPFNISEAECENRARHVTKRVWGIEYAGRCIDIRDSNFVDACKKVAVGVVPHNESAPEI
jgi:hypothetical protein